MGLYVPCPPPSHMKWGSGFLTGGRGGQTPWNPYLEPTYRQVRGSASSVCLVTLAFSPFFRGAATPGYDILNKSYNDILTKSLRMQLFSDSKVIVTH